MACASHSASRPTRYEAVSGLDLTVTAGQIFGFLGPNGAGKTTTLRILTTLLPADAGEAFVAGIDVLRSPQQVRRRIGYVGQLGGADGPRPDWKTSCSRPGSTA